MKIRQILNNNVALVKKGENEVFVVSKGIGFRKTKGQMILENEIEKMYILDSHDMLDHFSYLLTHSDPNDIILINKIIANGEMALGIKASDYLSLTMLDHLEFLLKRVEKGQFIKSPLIWDLKRFYPKHFEVGLQTLKIIEDFKGISLPKDEAASIALHFINMEESRKTSEGQNLTIRALGDIVSIIQLHFNIILDENSANYMRFTTHLQYFIQRAMKGETFESTESSLHRQISQTYPSCYQAVQKIKIYVRDQFNTEITTDEETYLMLHISRLSTS